MKKLLIAFFSLPLIGLSVVAQQKTEDIYDPSAQYEYPAEPLVREKLDQWQDQKFGIFLHWGLYSVEGIPESWTICGEPWPKRDSALSYEDYKKWYWGLSKKN